MLNEGGVEAFLKAMKSDELSIRKCGCGGLVNLATNGKHGVSQCSERLKRMTD